MYSLIAAFVVMVVVSCPSPVCLVQAFSAPSRKIRLGSCSHCVKRNESVFFKKNRRRFHYAPLSMVTDSRFHREEFIEWQERPSSSGSATRKVKSSSSFGAPVWLDGSGHDQVRSEVGENSESIDRFNIKHTQSEVFKNKKNSVNFREERITGWGDLMPSGINETLRYVSDILPGFKKSHPSDANESNNRSVVRKWSKTELEKSMKDIYGARGNTIKEIRAMTIISTSVLVCPFPQKIRHDRYYFATKAGEGAFDQSRPWPSQRRKSSKGIKPSIQVTPEEEELFSFLRHVVEDKKLSTTMRVAGGWVRDKLLATEEFRCDHLDGASNPRSIAHEETRNGYPVSANGKEVAEQSKTNGASPTNIIVSEPQKHHQKPVDIDIALDNMVGREFADEVNDWLAEHGRRTVSVGMMLKNPEKSKHLETATMKINNYWIDLVNLRTEAYAVDSRIPDQMGIGTAEEDAYRRDLTINSLFYNINTQKVEDFTGRGLEDLLNGVVSTPLPPLTTLLDDPLRVLRAVRFAARLGFALDDELKNAAKNPRVHYALAAKVSRERVGAELDLMLQSKDPVGAMRLLFNLNLLDTVFPVANRNLELATLGRINSSMVQGLSLLSTAHGLVNSFEDGIPEWRRNLDVQARQQQRCVYPASKQRPILGDNNRLLWYAAFLKPLRDSEQAFIQQHGKRISRRRKKSQRTLPLQLMIDDLKRCVREAEEVEKLQVAADEITELIVERRGGITASKILLSGIRVEYEETWPNDGDTVDVKTSCSMGGLNGEMDPRHIILASKENPMWMHAMNFRLECFEILSKIGDLWQEAFTLSLAEQLLHRKKDSWTHNSMGMRSQMYSDQISELVSQYNAFAAAVVELGLIGSWEQKPLLCGNEIKESYVLPNIPKGPDFRIVMEEQRTWMTLNPCGSKESLIEHLRKKFPKFTVPKKQAKREK